MKHLHTESTASPRAGESVLLQVMICFCNLIIHQNYWQLPVWEYLKVKEYGSQPTDLRQAKSGKL
jgi:hypothetical protein